MVMINRYGGVTQTLHWLTAILVLVAFVLGPGGSERHVYSAAADADRQLHETLGLCVFALTLGRLAWRALDVRPDPIPVARWMDLTARVVKFLLYVLLIAVPVTAILGAWLEGHPLTLIAGIEVQPWVEESHNLGSQIASLHGWLGDIILGVAGLHAVAALFHHFVLQDTVLLSMLPKIINLKRR